MMSHPRNKFPGGCRPAGSFLREAHWLSHVDAFRDSGYIPNVPSRKIQVGQVWKKDDTSENYLVTKIYNEALTSFVLLRKTGSETEPPMRIKISRAGAIATIPGFSYAQDSDDF
jgi:hypothetical protein